MAAAAAELEGTIHLDESHFPTKDSYHHLSRLIPTNGLHDQFQLIDPFPPPAPYGFRGYDDSSYPEIDGLAVFAKKTFRRYEDNNLRIHTFILSLKTEWYCRSGLATKWTYKALKLGATDFTFRLQHPDIVLPIQALLGSENVLVRMLCLEQACIDRLKVVRCTGLKSLSLSDMELTCDSFHDMIYCCPLIENLSLYNISRSRNDYEPRPRSMNIITLLINLTSLNLCFCQSQKLFRDNCWLSKLPNLKDLTLKVSAAADHEIPLISSASLETLNLTLYGHSSPEITIDVPRIRKFMFEGSVIPKFSFRSESRDELESRVSLTNREGISVDWFVKLSEYMTSMAGSRIFLSLYLHSQYSFDYQAGDIECSNPCELEDLTMDTTGLPSLSFCAVLDVLFRICHPKMITQYVGPPGNYYPEYMDPSGNDYSQYTSPCGYYGNQYNVSDVWCMNIMKNDVVLFRALKQGMKGKGLLRLPSQSMYGLRDLEEVNAEKLCNEVWMPHPFDSVIDSTSYDHQTRFRLQLKWKPSIVDY